MTTRSLIMLLTCVAAAAVLAAVGMPESKTATGQDSQSPGNPAKWAPDGALERLTPDNCAFLFVDHQTGLMNIVDNVDTNQYRHYVLALAETAKLHNVPVILTTSDASGPNGPLLPELREMFPDAPLIARPGQINAFDNEEFVDAVAATGRSKLVISGITTDVCVAFCTLSAVELGYEAHVVVDASGTMNERVQEASITRMAAAGATISNWFAVACELLSDWRNSAGPGSAKLFSDRLPGYADAIQSHMGAKQQSTNR